MWEIPTRNREYFFGLKKILQKNNRTVVQLCSTGDNPSLVTRRTEQHYFILFLFFIFKKSRGIQLPLFIHFCIYPFLFSLFNTI